MVTVWTPLVVVGVILLADVWVFVDARRWAEQGSPVRFQFGSFAIETPQAWAIACVLVFILFMPIYAVARRS